MAVLPPDQATFSLYDHSHGALPDKELGRKHIRSDSDASLTTKKYVRSNLGKRCGWENRPTPTRILITMLVVSTLLLASAALSSALPHNPIRVLVNLVRAALPDSAGKPIPTDALSTWSPPLTVMDGPFGSVRGPLCDYNFPDPAIIYDNGTMYAFGTNNKGLSEYGMIHVQVAKSTDNRTWNLIEGWDVLPTVGKWQTGRRVWAPDVVKLDNGRFVLYYADDIWWAPQHHCIGAATSDTIIGPYTPMDQPLACPDVRKTGGAIDPDGFLDLDGRRYITYKVDGNSIGHGGSCSNMVTPIVPTPIMLQEVNATNGIDKIGDAIEILDRDMLDGPLIEGPTLHRSDEGFYFLFYSSNCFVTPLYDVAYATATDLRGPYTKSNRHLLGTGDGKELGLDLIGPGGADMLKDSNVMAFHAHRTKGDGDVELWNNYAKHHGHERNEPRSSIHQRNEMHRKTRGARQKPLNSLIRPFWTCVVSFNGTQAQCRGRPLGYMNLNDVG